MPKTTFVNLDKKKQTAIEKAAVTEFAAYGFHGARLNHIVEAAGIAKGSFYQYFEDLSDLYFHLLDSFSKRKMELIQQELDKHQGDGFFDKYRLVLETSSRFLARISEDARRVCEHLPSSRDIDSRRLTRLRKQSEENVYKPLIAEAIRKGEIIRDADFALAIVTSTSGMIRQYLTSKTGTAKLRRVYRDGKLLDDAIDRFVDFLRVGLTSISVEGDSRR
jgi:AcrR family transcriptional regulator